MFAERFYTELSFSFVFGTYVVRISVWAPSIFFFFFCAFLPVSCSTVVALFHVTAFTFYQQFNIYRWWSVVKETRWSNMLLTLLFYALIVTNLYLGTWSNALSIFFLIFYFSPSRQCWSGAWNEATVCPLKARQFVIHNCTHILRYMNGVSTKYFTTVFKACKKPRNMTFELN